MGLHKRIFFFPQTSNNEKCIIKINIFCVDYLVERKGERERERMSREKSGHTNSVVKETMDQNSQAIDVIVVVAVGKYTNKNSMQDKQVNEQYAVVLDNK